MSAIDPHTHFRILEDIARDLSGDINFPTCMDAAVLVRNTLKDPQANLERVVQVVGVDPLISSKLLRLANSVTYNPMGKRVSDLTTAIARLGFEAVRTTSLAVAMDQMLKSCNLTAYDDIGRGAWEHSLQVAAIARVLARRIGRVKPEEAMLAGLVQNIGIFYLLFRAAEYAEYHDNREAILDLIHGWHASIGESLLHILGLPEHLTEAICDRDRRQDIEAPSSLRDILYFANLLASEPGYGVPVKTDPALAEQARASRERFADLLHEADDDISDVRAALAA
ncbi:MAG: HDOD domain-containing protein [Azonexus sp.]|jgi:HD-like signal output (HDOD) protein|uniref:HDOD domain-containing protein n=1 Tax=Azonexus sp. TaxID=1872668 RepID=UPI002819AC53|nr:HDOD domain-containing protein [Azonexus sp.]MDR0776125.1 HDOD domain-containing protein [Azonexus sp.]